MPPSEPKAKGVWKGRPVRQRKVAQSQRERAAIIDRLSIEGVSSRPSQIDNINLLKDWSHVLEDEWEYLRISARDNFWTFFLHSWGVLYGPHAEDWLSRREPIAEMMAYWFQEQVEAWEESRRNREDKQRRIMVMVTREFGKTTMFTQAGLLWLHLRNPNLSTYIGADAVENAVSILRGIKPVLDGSDKHAKFTQMYGNWYNPDLIWTRDAVIHSARTIATRKEPSFGCWGVETGITGKHPDVLCLDDPNNYERMESNKGWLEVVNQHCAGLQPALQVDGLLIYVGTPYGDNDNLRASIKRNGIATLTGIPMVDFAPREGGLWHVLHIPGRDANEQPTVPRVWPESRMQQFKEENDARYAAQVLLRPELAESVPLTREQVEDCLVNEDDVPLKMLRYTMHLDTAWKDPSNMRKGDESVVQIWGHFRDGSGDVVFVEGHSSNMWRGEQFYEQVVMLIQKYTRLNRKILLVTDEISPGKKGANRIMLESFCHAKGIPAPPMVEISRAGKNKFSARIIPSATYWQDGHVKLLRTAPGVSKLVEQMSRLTPEMAFDDWADAQADVFNPLVYQAMRRHRKPGRSEDWSNPTDGLLKERLPFYTDVEDIYEPI